eukprot:Gregarina_sp_Poly_1__4464@NODE_23_length_20322_cov_242_373192_g21_i0_p7_GENE_NODE_23_length_20322_cov_242_373192_g21_i0NODE_23_length_20322_cov_242_373192_g21_i0_p7_ORF_typecomplete_len315_score40_31ATG16/PF08614_11/4e03ATG16/PF08614_11/0_051ATG16/PF08614_11/27RasGAP_C/PF03836_15/2_4RasGAP_C/PF03836_15/5_2ADIP/PF11559_8/1_3e03ADIP/PF11559_8/4e02ADIP/PF11559_8/0_058Vir_act_alpha_C/PF10400_9/0_27Vir_act_alpha_C/PF10400_9/1_6e03Vir_act_alpha_C/PF10400_9/8_9e02BRE1/PF08647_11/2_3BRE1/PF08647_11/70MT
MEKMCLIIGMDHENVRSDIEALKGHCDERLRHITQKLQLLSLEKLAWSFHCRRIIRTIEWYGREIAHKLSMDGNEQFATVVKELERLSAELAERDVELAMARKLCSAMDGENQLLKDQLGRYHRYERCLDPENNAVLFDDEEVRSLGKETDRANLLGQILYYRQRYLDVAEREKEVSMLIEDLRTVNREIYADLQASKEREQQAQANARYYQKALALERRTFEKDLTSAAVALKTAEDKSKNLQEELQKVHKWFPIVISFSGQSMLHTWRVYPRRRRRKRKLNVRSGKNGRNGRRETRKTGKRAKIKKDGKVLD